MRKVIFGLVATGLLAASAQASEWSPPADVRAGAFIGARINLPIGGRTAARPRAALAIAPTQARIASDGMVRTRIGDGLALDFTSARKPTLTVAGVRADYALGLRPQPGIAAKEKSGVSTGGWIAIGVGATVVVGAIALGLWADKVRDSGD